MPLRQASRPRPPPSARRTPVGRQDAFTEFVLPDEIEMRNVGPILEDMMSKNAVLVQDFPPE